jgi:hypothetical protein
MSDAFEKYWERFAKGRDLSRLPMHTIAFDAFKNGRNSMLAELRAKFPNELEAHTQVKLLCKDDDVSKSLVMAMWFFISKRVFG